MTQSEKLNHTADHFSVLFKSTRSYHHYEKARAFRTKALKAENAERRKSAKAKAK